MEELVRFVTAKRWIGFLALVRRGTVSRIGLGRGVGLSGRCILVWSRYVCSLALNFVVGPVGHDRRW